MCLRLLVAQGPARARRGLPCGQSSPPSTTSAATWVVSTPSSGRRAAAGCDGRGRLWPPHAVRPLCRLPRKAFGAAAREGCSVRLGRGGCSLTAPRASCGPGRAMWCFGRDMHMLGGRGAAGMTRHPKGVAWRACGRIGTGCSCGRDVLQELECSPPMTISLCLSRHVKPPYKRV